MSVRGDEGLLDGVAVVEAGGEPVQLAGRLLAELGADVTVVAPRYADHLRQAAWGHGKTTLAADAAELPARLAEADIVLVTPYEPGVAEVDRSAAPGAVWVDVTPFGLDGPRSAWRASDLGVMASTGNMYATGDADRAPVRPAQPASVSHGGPEVAFAALTGLASGRPQHVDLSLQEVVLIASMGAAGRHLRAPFRGKRSGSAIGRTREIWPSADGFVSFGLRGGKARVPNLELISKLVAEAGIAGADALTSRDWSAYNHNTATDEELRAIEAPIAEYFSTRTMAGLYELACETNLMLAPANSPRELYASAQLAARDFFADDGRPARFAIIRPPSSRSFPGKGTETVPDRRQERTAASGAASASAGAWAGTNILEFGSGAAGPIATRYFAEHGATVLRIESRVRPDFLRTYALSPKNPHGLEGSDMFDALNVNKLGVTLNMKHPRGLELAKRLAFEWADAISENFAPKAMRGFGMDYDTLAAEKPDLVMISACLQGQTGPHRNYPGFGGQGAALSGFNSLTGWPDREPLGPHGTITDSLAPRFVAAGLAAALLYRRRTGRGIYLDLSQVEVAVWSLTPWMLAYQRDGRIIERNGNGDASGRAIVHGAFRCAGDDRWVAIAAWDEDDAERLAKVAGDDVAAWCAVRSPLDVAETLQAAGVEAVPVQDFDDTFADPQLAHRGHFVRLTHPNLGEGAYERNGFRLSDGDGGYRRSSPTLGQDAEHVLGDILGLSRAEQQQLADDGVLE
jgi:crotonobetainyl-CoA:carnitine CoA-transferase CaiB-like acyl-CoA transferase